MTHVMCNHWKKIFTLAPLVALTMFSPFWDTWLGFQNLGTMIRSKVIYSKLLKNYGHLKIYFIQKITWVF
jgi:hypothetical protein